MSRNHIKSSAPCSLQVKAFGGHGPMAVRRPQLLPVFQPKGLCICLFRVMIEVVV
jgi:hypothetical protein